MKMPDKQITLMLDLFNSAIVTKIFPLDGSPCHKKLLEVMKACGKKPTAKSRVVEVKHDR